MGRMTHYNPIRPDRSAPAPDDVYDAVTRMHDTAAGRPARRPIRGGLPLDPRTPAPEPSPLPSAPCFYCGERGWCRHRQP